MAQAQMTNLWSIKFNRIKFTKEFFDLSLKAKYDLILSLPEEILNNSYSHNAIVFAILQHSSLDAKKNCPILWERQQSAAAKKADEKELCPIPTN